MIALYCITATGLLMSMQYRANRKLDEHNRPSQAEIERRLDAENMRLDNELADLLAEHRRLCQRGSHGDSNA